MKTIKTMAIISIVWLTVMLVIVLNLEGFYKDLYEEAIAVFILTFLYSMSFTIVALVQSSKTTKTLSVDKRDYNIDLLNLNNLKEKGILNEEQFEEKKEQILYILSSELRNSSKKN